MATPVVSGSAALIKAVNPKLNASEIRQVLLSSAIQNPVFKGQVGDLGRQLFLPEALELAQGGKEVVLFYKNMMVPRMMTRFGLLSSRV